MSHLETEKYLNKYLEEQKEQASPGLSMASILKPIADSQFTYTYNSGCPKK